MRSIPSWIRKHSLECYIILIILIKTAIASGLPIFAITNAIHDDQMMVQHANYLLRGEWLGPYSNLTLVKGITFPLYLVIIYLLGIPYTASVVLFYGLACYVLLLALKGLIKKNVSKGIIFTILYFLPVNAGLQNVMRVYRNSILPTLTLLVIACFLGIYLNRNKKSILAWAIGAGVSLSAFWNLREDSLWVLPFAAAASMITLITICIDLRKGKANLDQSSAAAIQNSKSRNGYLCRIALIVLVPYLLLAGSNTAIRAINKHYYHTYTRIDLNEGNFPKMMKALYAVEQDEIYERVSIPKSTIDKVYVVSPSFAEMKDYLDQNFGSGWDATDGKLDGQIEDGWLFWCIRDGITAANHFNTASDMEAYCGQVAAEINEAFETESLTKRAGFSMPSALMSPWRNDRFETLILAFSEAYWYVAGNQGQDLYPDESIGSDSNIRAFEALTHNNAIFPADNEIDISVSGWVVSLDDADQADVGIYQNGQQILLFSKAGGNDVYNSFSDEGMELENAKNSRFSGSIHVQSTDHLDLCILKNGAVISTYDLTKGQYGGSADTVNWYLDDVSFTKSEGAVETISTLAVPRMMILNTINSLYRAMGTVFPSIGLISYGVLSLLLVLSLIRRKNARLLLDRWLILTGILGSELINVIGVSYTHISSCNAIHDLYLAASFPLQAAFWLLSILFILQIAGEVKIGKTKKPLKYLVSYKNPKKGIINHDSNNQGADSMP